MREFKPVEQRHTLPSPANDVILRRAKSAPKRDQGTTLLFTALASSEILFAQP